MMGRDARASDGVGRARDGVDRRGIGEFDTCRVVSGPSGARVMPRGPTHVRLPVPAATHRKRLTRSLVKTTEAVRIRAGAVERVDAYLSGVNLLVRAVGHHLRVMNDPWRLSMTLGTPRNRPRRADDGDPMDAFSRAEETPGKKRRTFPMGDGAGGFTPCRRDFAGGASRRPARTPGPFTWSSSSLLSHSKEAFTCAGMTPMGRDVAEVTRTTFLSERQQHTGKSTGKSR